MLTPKVKECVNCQSIDDILCEIDKKLTKYGTIAWNNMSLELGAPYNINNIRDLVYYKRILSKRLFNPYYACDILLKDIISHVKILLNK